MTYLFRKGRGFITIDRSIPKNHPKQFILVRESCFGKGGLAYENSKSPFKQFYDVKGDIQ